MTENEWIYNQLIYKMKNEVADAVFRQSSQ